MSKEVEEAMVDGALSGVELPWHLYVEHQQQLVDDDEKTLTDKMLWRQEFLMRQTLAAEVRTLRAEAEAMRKALREIEGMGCSLVHDDSCCISESGVRTIAEEVLARLNDRAKERP